MTKSSVAALVIFSLLAGCASPSPAGRAGATIVASPYEPAALKRLMGRYATRESELDRLLRAERFVDLHAVVRQAVRASVESYSLKELEPFYRFARQIPLRDAALQRHALERRPERAELSGQSLGDARHDGRRAQEERCQTDQPLLLAARHDGQAPLRVDADLPNGGLP